MRLLSALIRNISLIIERRYEGTTIDGRKRRLFGTKLMVAFLFFLLQNFFFHFYILSQTVESLYFRMVFSNGPINKLRNNAEIEKPPLNDTWYQRHNIQWLTKSSFHSNKQYL